METLASLESFVRSAELGGISAAARRLSVTPAAISRNVAALEGNLGVRLFHRSTRGLTLTEAGERFLFAVRDNLAGVVRRMTLRRTIRAVAKNTGQHGQEPWIWRAGTLDRLACRSPYPTCQSKFG